jgi:hypothetical protein
MLIEPEYLIKLSISLALVALFYKLVLRRHTFYTWNRWYLLGYAALSFFIPLVDLSYEVPPEVWTQSTLVQAVPRVPELPNSAPVYYEPTGTVAAPLQFGDYLLMLIGLGCLLMTVRFVIPWIAYLRIRRNATLVDMDYDVAVFHSDKDIVPFSFGKNIFFNPGKHTPEELRDIILHELVHVRQKHTLDVLFAELLCILNWYNPFAWMIRHAIRQNLEFIADREVIEQGIDTKEYQYLLLKVVGYTDFRVASPFNLSPLKQRILMMNRSKTARIQLGRFLFVLPLLLVVLISFSSSTSWIEPTFLAKSKFKNGNIVRFTPGKKTLHLAGLLLDDVSGRPISDFQMVVTLNDVRAGTITSDEQGFYHWSFDIQSLPDSLVSVELSGASHFSMSMVFMANVINNDVLDIKFLKRPSDPESRNDNYPIFDTSYPTGEQVRTKEEIKKILLQELPKYVEQHELKVAFRRKHKNPKEAITKFRNAYFNDHGNLIGYEALTEFFMDNEKVSYQEVNRVFRNKTFARLNSGKLHNHGGLSNQYRFFTFTPYKDQPHPSMVKKKDVEWVDVEDFDLAILEKEPYMLDGFRQTYGMGSNLMPLKEEIKRVAILKNDLAHYYDKKLKKLWWIETRPPEEVQGRPDFASAGAD